MTEKEVEEKLRQEIEEASYTQIYDESDLLVMIPFRRLLKIVLKIRGEEISNLV